MNSVATEIFDAAADADQGDRRERVRAKAAALGMLVTIDAPPVSERRRKRALASMRGVGPIADQLIREGRERF